MQREMFYVRARVCVCVCALTEISVRYSEIKKMDILSAVKPATA
jgi:hypothetical protein